MGDILIATSINSKIFFEEQPNIFDKITSKKLLDVRANIRNEYSTIIVGGNTIKNDNPTLLNTDKSNIRVIIDKYADLNINSKIFTINPQMTYLILLKRNRDYEEKLLNLGVNLVYLDNNSEEEIINTIKSISKGKVLIEGGARTIGMFLSNNCVRNIKIVQFPVLLPSNSLSFDQYNNTIFNCKLSESYVIEKKYIYQCYEVNTNDKCILKKND